MFAVLQVRAAVHPFLEMAGVRLRVPWRGLDEHDPSLSRGLGAEHSLPHMGMATGCIFDAPPAILSRRERCFDVRIGLSRATRQTSALGDCLKGVKQGLGYRAGRSPSSHLLQKLPHSPVAYTAVLTCLPSTKEIVNDVFEHIHRKYHISPMRHLANVVVTLKTQHAAEPCEAENDPLGREDLEHPRTRLAEHEVRESGPVSGNHASSVCHAGCLLAQRHCLKTDDLKASRPQHSCDDVFFIEDVPPIHAP